MTKEEKVVKIVPPIRNYRNRSKKREMINQARVVAMYNRMMELEYMLSKILEGQISIYECTKMQQTNIDVTLSDLKKVLKKSSL